MRKVLWNHYNYNDQTYNQKNLFNIVQNSVICGYYLKIYSFKFLCAKFQTSPTLFDVFSLGLLFCRYIDKVQVKILDFNRQSKNIDNCENCLRRK